MQTFPLELLNIINNIKEIHEKSLERKIKAAIYNFYKEHKLEQEKKQKITIPLSLEDVIELESLIEKLAQHKYTSWQIDKDRKIKKRFLKKEDILIKGISQAVQNITQYGIEVLPNNIKIHNTTITISIPTESVKQIENLKNLLLEKNGKINNNALYTYSIKLGMMYYKYKININ